MDSTEQIATVSKAYVRGKLIAFSSLKKKKQHLNKITKLEDKIKLEESELVRMFENLNTRNFVN